MFEIPLGILMVVTVARIAYADGESAVIWGAVALVLGFLCLRYIPIAYARILVAGVLTIGAMTAYKIATKK
jgi:hypothetical protein